MEHRARTRGCVDDGIPMRQPCGRYAGRRIARGWSRWRTTEHRSGHRGPADGKGGAKKPAPRGGHGKRSGLNLDSEQSARLLLYGIVAAVMLIAAGFVVFGYWYSVVRPRHRTVLAVDGISVSYEAMKRRMAYEFLSNTNYQTQSGLRDPARGGVPDAAERADDDHAGREQADRHAHAGRVRRRVPRADRRVARGRSADIRGRSAQRAERDGTDGGRTAATCPRGCTDEEDPGQVQGGSAGDDAAGEARSDLDADGRSGASRRSI